MATESHAYGDPDDAIAAGSIEREDSSTEHDWLERDFDLVRRAVGLIRSEPPWVALDAGAGTGRLFPVLAETVHGFAAVERDPDRAAVARRAARGVASCSGVITADAASITFEHRFDLVVCSHVVQHLARDARASLVMHLRGLMNPGAILLLTFSSTGLVRPAGYLSSGTPSGGVRTALVSEREFEAACSSGTALPVWHAGDGEVATMVSEQGLTVVDSATYRGFHHRVGTTDGERRVAAFDSYVIAEAS